MRFELNWKRTTANFLVAALFLGVSHQDATSARAQEVAAKESLNAEKATGTRTLDDALDSMAKRLADYQKNEQTGALSLGDFHQPGGTSGEALVKNRLKSKLEKQGAQLGKPGSTAINITGDIIRDDEEGDATVKVVIECKMVNRANKDLGKFREKVEVDKQDDVARLLGLTVDLKEADDKVTGAAPAATAPKDSPPNPTPPAATTPPANVPVEKRLEKREETFKERADDPQVFADGSKVAASSTSPYRVQIVVEVSPGKFAPAPLSTEGGVAFVELKPGDTYAVELINQASHDVGVELYIDGISSFELTDIPIYRDTNKWMVPRGQTFRITGWHKNNQENFKFVVTETPDSLVAQRFPDRGTSSVGTISALFYPAWKLNEPIPNFELVAAKPRAGTAQGPKGATNAEESVRYFGKTLLASVTVRYERPIPLDLPIDGAVTPAK